MRRQASGADTPTARSCSRSARSRPAPMSSCRGMSRFASATVSAARRRSSIMGRASSSAKWFSFRSRLAGRRNRRGRGRGAAPAAERPALAAGRRRRARRADYAGDDPSAGRVASQGGAGRRHADRASGLGRHSPAREFPRPQRLSLPCRSTRRRTRRRRRRSLATPPPRAGCRLRSARRLRARQSVRGGAGAPDRHVGSARRPTLSTTSR